MVTKQILIAIKQAIDDPEEYSSGESKNQLRAAFDALTSQVYASIFGAEPLSRMNARQELNALKKKDYKAGQWKKIEVLREALRVSEYTLHAKDYLDHTEDISGFINNNLQPLYKAVK
ncbi:MAG: hypothetical protein QOF62_1040 [Pyrinomonadaceae bacterium]|jgi:hypothetical protein|nr:hypothetical protein [Pyrinomonadaceae bacterium]